MLKTTEKLLLCFILLIFPSQLSFHFWPSFTLINGFRVDYLSPVIYFTDILILGLLFLGWINKRTFSVPKIKFLPARLALIFLVIANIIFSLSPLFTLYKFFRLLEYLLLYSYLIGNKQLFMKSFSKILPLVLLWVCCLVFWQFYLQHSVGGYWYLLGERNLMPTMLNVAKTTMFGSEVLLRPYATFSHPNTLAGFLCVSIFILVYFQQKRLISKTFSYWVLGLSAYAILLAFSRAALFISAVFFLPLIHKRLYKIMILVSLLLLAYWSTGIIYSASFSERILLLSKAAQSIMQYPLFGIGLGNFPMFQISPLFFNIFLNFQPVHNVFLLLAAELGLPLFGLIVCFSIINIRYIWARISLSLRNSLLAIFALSLVDHYWITSHQNILLLVFLLALISLESIPETYAE